MNNTASNFSPELYGAELHIDKNVEYTIGKPIVVDVETDEKDNFVGIGWTQDGLCITYITNLEWIRKMLESCPLIGHNLKFDIKQLIGWGISIKPEQYVGDTCLMSYVQNTTKASHSLKDLAKEYLGMEWPKYKEIVGTGKKKVTLDKQPVELVARYNGMDVLATYRLYEYFQKTLTPQQKRYLETVELPTARVLMEMELRGVRVNIEYLKKLDKEFETKLTLIENGVHLYWHDKEHFNINSNAQVAKLLLNQGAVLPKTAKGNFKVDKQTLEGLKHVPVVPLLLEYSKIEKLKSTYTTTLLEKQREGKVYAQFNQISRDSKGTSVGISTGRLSSSNPNLQNIPTKTEEGKLIRKAFIPEDGKVFIDADYCVSPETKILKADLTWCNADQIKIGDEIIGFDEIAGKTQRFKRGIVEFTRRRETDCVRIDTDSQSLVCSSEHKLLVVRPKYAKNSKSNHRIWVKAKNILVGDKIVWFLKPWETENSNEAGWISGVFDGEGWVYQGIGIGQNDGVVWDKIVSLLGKYGYSFKNYKNKSGCNRVRVAGAREGMELIGRFRPIRLLAKSHKLWEGLRTFNSFSKTTTLVEKVGAVGNGDVISIQTSTKTLITNGMFSHNCQIEPRLVAHFSKDPLFIRTYREERDIYQELVEGTGRSRNDGKTFMLALLYGAQPKKLSSVFKCSEAEAESIVKRIMSKLPGVTAWINRTKYEAHQKKGVWTLFKRWVPLPLINSDDRYERMHWERVAVNTVIQGSAAEVMKLSLIKLKESGYVPNLTVHDEFLIEVDPSDYYGNGIQYAEGRIMDILTSVVKLDVPLKVELGNGDNWGEAK